MEHTQPRAIMSSYTCIPNFLFESAPLPFQDCRRAYHTSTELIFLQVIFRFGNSTWCIHDSPGYSIAFAARVWFYLPHKPFRTVRACTMGALATYARLYFRIVMLKSHPIPGISFASTQKNASGAPSGCFSRPNLRRVRRLSWALKKEPTCLPSN
jgi:hypothetical protein